MKQNFSWYCFFFFLCFAPTTLAKTFKLNQADYKAINKKLALLLELEPLDKVDGFYNTKEGKLDGEFDVKEEYTGHDVENNAYYLYKNHVKGNYLQGKKHGTWFYSYVFDDGLEMFERHDIKIVYKEGKCLESHFDGVIGHIMPLTQHKFKSADLCTPSTIREKAWQLWSDEYAGKSI